MIGYSTDALRDLSRIDWQNPVSDWAESLGLVDGWMAMPNHFGYGTGTWRSLRGRYNGTLTNMDPATDWVTDSPMGGWGSLDLGGTSFITNSTIPDAPFLGAMSIVWTGRVDTGSAFRHFCGKHSGVGGANNPFDFRTTNDATPQVTCIRASAFGAREHKGPLVLLGEFAQYAVSFSSGRITDPPQMFRNGVAASVSAAGGGVGTVSGSDAPLRIGRRADGAVQMDGAVSSLLLFSTALTAAQVAALYEDSLQGYPRFLRRLPTRRTFFVAAGGATNLDNVDSVASVVSDAPIVNIAIDLVEAASVAAPRSSADAVEITVDAGNADSVAAATSGSEAVAITAPLADAGSRAHLTSDAPAVAITAPLAEAGSVASVVGSADDLTVGAGAIDLGEAASVIAPRSSADAGAITAALAEAGSVAAVVSASGDALAIGVTLAEAGSVAAPVAGDEAVGITVDAANTDSQAATLADALDMLGVFAIGNTDSAVAVVSAASDVTLPSDQHPITRYYEAAAAI